MVTTSKFKIVCIALHEIALARLNTTAIDIGTCNVPRMTKIFKLRQFADSDDIIGMLYTTVETLELYKLLNHLRSSLFSEIQHFIT